MLLEMKALPPEMVDNNIMLMEIDLNRTNSINYYCYYFDGCIMHILLISNNIKLLSINTIILSSVDYIYIWNQTIYICLHCKYRNVYYLAKADWMPKSNPGPRPYLGSTCYVLGLDEKITTIIALQLLILICRETSKILTNILIRVDGNRSP